MAKYTKIKSVLPYGDFVVSLKSGNLLKEYNNCLSYIYTTPHVFYTWLIHRKKVVFFKRPRNFSDSSLVYKVSIFFATREDAKRFAVGVTRETLEKVFKRTNYMII